MINTFIKTALTLQATVYGFGEYNCCDVGEPCPCSKGAITASGETFDPEEPSAAVPAPSNVRMRPTSVYLRYNNGPCVRVRINDKANPRWIGNRGLDLSKGAVEELTQSDATTYWSGKVDICFWVLEEPTQFDTFISFIGDFSYEKDISNFEFSLDN